MVIIVKLKCWPCGQNPPLLNMYMCIQKIRYWCNLINSAVYFDSCCNQYLYIKYMTFMMCVRYYTGIWIIGIMCIPSCENYWRVSRENDTNKTREWFVMTLISTCTYICDKYMYLWQLHVHVFVTSTCTCFWDNYMYMYLWQLHYISDNIMYTLLHVHVFVTITCARYYMCMYLWQLHVHVLWQLHVHTITCTCICDSYMYM